MRILCASAVLAAALAVPAPASAQLLGQTGGVRMASLVGVHVFGLVESESLAAQRSFDAVLAGSSKSQPMLLGAGFQVTRIWHGAFGRFSASHSSNVGSRVFVDSSKNVHSLNVPITIAITPIEIGGGWRFGDGARRVVPYVGAAVLLQRYTETSETGTTADNVDERDKGQSLFGGIDIVVGRVHVGAEGFYRRVPNAIGAAGASLDFDEDSLGGTGFRVLFGVGF